MEHITLRVEGMSCGGCARRLDAGLRKVEGVHVREVTIGEAQLDFDPDKTTMTRIYSAISELGFTATIK